MNKLIAVLVAGLFAAAPAFAQDKAAPAKKEEAKKEAAAPAKKEEAKKDAAPTAKKEAAPKKEKKGGC